MGWRTLSVALLVSTCLLTSPALAAETLFGVTGTNLVTIDPTNPANVTVIGPHSLPAGAGIAGIFELTYDPLTDRLLGLASTSPDTYQFFRFNRSTGQATALGTLPNPGNAFIYESTEFVGGARNQVIISQAPTSGPQTGISFQLNAVNPDTGVLVPLTNNSRDNDFSVWDSRRDRFYATDPNASVSPNIYEVNLITGANTDFVNVFEGFLNGPGELAYSRDRAAIFAVDFGTGPNFFRIDLNAAGNPATVVPLGNIAGDHVLGIAFAPAVPEPTSLALLGLIAAIAKKRKPK